MPGVRGLCLSERGSSLDSMDQKLLGQGVLAKSGLETRQGKDFTSALETLARSRLWGMSIPGTSILALRRNFFMEGAAQGVVGPHAWRCPGTTGRGTEFSALVERW